MPDSNSALDFIFSRRSIRKFTAEPLSAEQIDLLQQAALAAPSAMNRHPGVFISSPDRQSLLPSTRRP